MRQTGRNRPLLTVAAAWTSVTAGSWMVKVTLAVLTFQVGGTPAVAAALLVRTLPAVLLGPAAGAWVGRLPARTGLAVTALSCALLALAGGLLAPLSWPVLVATAVIALDTLAYRTAQSIAVLALVKSSPALQRSLRRPDRHEVRRLLRSQEPEGDVVVAAPLHARADVTPCE